MGTKKKPVKKASAKKRIEKKAAVKGKKKNARLTTSAASNEREFPIVGMGASAGGLEAIEGFFSHVRPDSNLAFVVIQHLAPGHKSIMDALLKKYTEMKVVQIEDGMKVKPNCVYLNPPGKDVSIMNRRLLLADPTERRGARLPIDHFFRSLAEDQEEMAICIVFSGTGADGTLGLRAIKGAGGMAMVQDESQARYDNMPRSAIDTGLVDYVLPVEKMFGELAKYAKHPYLGGAVKALTGKQKFEECVRKIFMLIRSETGHDFSHYKRNTIQRRIERRMAVHQIDKMDDYVRRLQENSAEVEALFKDMLITVTNFFRDPDAFEVLSKEVVPSVLVNKDAEDFVRVWVPGCATGEEAYSIAMLIVENMSKLNKHLAVQVFATDIDQDAIEYARHGSYPESISADVSVERLKHFFVKEENSFRVKKQLREIVVFATQNLTKDPPFSKLDLVSCRNVLIYMDTVLQKKILSLFHYVLNPGGYLFLGTSETTGDSSDRFSVVSAKWKVFERKSVLGGRDPGYPTIPLYDSTVEGQRGEEKRVPNEAGIRQIAERTILQNYAPPCVLIDQKHEILYFHGKTEKFLTPPTGEPTFDILKMAREDIRYRLSTIIHQASKEKKAVTAKGLQIKHDGDIAIVDLVVRPVAEDVQGAGLMMVIFESKELTGKRAGKKKEVKGLDKTDSGIISLEQELQSTKEYLQTTIEELETSNEELKSTNEELQSTNEELQSTNEELDTSREELQSTNEELETVNSELQDKVAQLSAANDDLNNLLGSTEIGTIFLDIDLCVNRFTPSASKIFNLIKTDTGRPISDITSTIDYPNLCADVEETLRTLAPKQTDLQAADGKWYSIRVLPYRTVENVINGVVITFVDITKQVQQESDVRRLATVLMDSNDAITVRELDGSIISWNKGAAKMYGYTEDEALNMNADALVPESIRAEARLLAREVAAGISVGSSVQTERLTKDGRIIDVWLTATKLVDDSGKVVSIATTERDITELMKVSGKEENHGQ